MIQCKYPDRIGTSELPEIDKRLKRSLKRQIVNNIIYAIENGLFAIGQKLPSLEDLSCEYDVSMDTIAKSYNELKRRGYVVSSPRKGYYITDPR
jgi:DNA-binding transcriptional regulator YhcF (GntR family)